MRYTTTKSEDLIAIAEKATVLMRRILSGLCRSEHEQFKEVLEISEWEYRIGRVYKE